MRRNILKNIDLMLDIIKRPPLGIVLALTIFACLFLGFFVDKEIIVFVKENPQYFYIDVFKIITKVGDATGWLLAASIGFLFCVFVQRSKYLIQYHSQLYDYALKFWYVILSCLLSGVIHHAIKITLGRYRPRYLFSEQWYGINPLNFNIAHNSFPSGHTQTIFAITAALTILYPRLGIVFFSIAVLVGISRIILIAHYPSDVIFGAYLGLSTAILVRRYYLDKRLIIKLH